MLGTIGSYIKAASEGVPAAKSRVNTVFAQDFHRPSGWVDMLNHIPGWDVNVLLRREPAWWTVESFQALYVACWIFHPVEKGSYMLQLGSASDYGNVRQAYDSLLKNGGLQSRISSHLSKSGASAHKGWNFLSGYHELLVQIEGEKGGAPFLYLKCEGHALSGGGISALMHGLSWVVKSCTGKGKTASPELHNLAKDSLSVELRAAENFSKPYAKLLKQLGLSGTMVTVDQVVNELWLKCGFPNPIPVQVTNNTHTLGRSMLGPQGFIAVFKKQKNELKKNKVTFNDKLEKDLTEVAHRLVDTAVAYPQQHFNEIRVTPQKINQALQVFRGYI